MLEDLRHASRRIIKDWRTSVLIVAMLGLGIGANASVFSVLEATVLDPFPYEDSDRIVEVVRGSRQRFSGAFNYQAFTALRDNNDIFQRVAGYRDGSLAITIGESTEVRMGAEVSAGVFALLGVQPFLGRGFTPDEQGRGRAPVAIISHDLWEARYGSDPDIVGGIIRVEGEDRTIIGVMPRGFTFYQAASVWIPLPVDAATADDDPYRFGVIARLRDDMALSQAHAAMGALGETLEPLFNEPLDEFERLRAAMPLRIATLAEGWNPAGLQYIGALFQFVAGFVLLVVCANLASLLLARGVSRQRELAVRQALGAPRHRLVRQLFAEHLLFAVVGGVLGLLLAQWGRDLLVVVLSSRALVGVEMQISVRVVAFVSGVTGLAAVAFGILPALELTRPDLGAALREWGAGVTGPRRIRRRERSLAIVQIAMALVLLIGVTMTARSLAALQQVDPGFDSERVFRVLLSLPDEYIYDDDSRRAVLNRVIDELQAAAGIEAVAWQAFPGQEVIGTFRDRRGVVETANGPSALSAADGADAVNDEYFRAFGLNVLRGRTFDAHDRRGTSRVVVLSERAANILWPGDDAIGKTIRFPGAEAWLTVIGVVSSKVRVRSTSYDRSEWGMRAEPWPDVYVAVSQYDLVPSNLLWVRPRVDADTLAGIVRTVASPDLPRSTVRTVWESDYEPHQFAYRVVLQVLGALGVVAVLLSALGTYSVISHVWAQRARELGVRVALGATPRDIFRLVMEYGRSVALVGIVVGSFASLAVYRIAAGLFLGISSWDPITYGGVALLMLTLSAVAGLAPARRATRTDSIAVLRQE